MPRPKGGYKNAAGQRLPGVTTILNQLGWNKNALTFWGFKVGQENPNSRSPYDIRDAAADVGTAVHTAIESSLSGTDDEIVLEGLRGALEGEQADRAIRALRGWLQWRDLISFQPLEMEVSLVSERYGYGGTIDLIGETAGQLSLIDWKATGGIYRETLIQVEAYRRLWDECNPDRPITGGLYVLRADPKNGGFEFRYWPELSEYWPPFLYARNLYDCDKRLKL